MPQTRLPQIWLIDACCALNLQASGRFEEILRAPFQGKVVTYAMASIAVGEAGFLRRGGTGDDAGERDPIDWSPVTASGLLRVEIAETSDEVAAFVSLASQVDDGEAMSLAIALVRGYGVVTDDRKAQRLSIGVPCRGTLDLLHNWATSNSVDAGTLGGAIRSIEDRANFAAPRGHILREWWNMAAAQR